MAWYYASEAKAGLDRAPGGLAVNRSSLCFCFCVKFMFFLVLFFEQLFEQFCAQIIHG